MGSARTIQVNVRMIAATHRDLAAMIREKEFREDLFYRFNVFPIEIPPLRERREDISLLVHFSCRGFPAVCKSTSVYLKRSPWRPWLMRRLAGKYSRTREIY